MNKSISSKTVSLIFSVLVLTIAVGFYVVAFEEPTVAPPGGDFYSPLNTGPDSQTKYGQLTFTAFYDADDNAYFVDPAAPVSARLRGDVNVEGDFTVAVGKGITLGGVYKTGWPISGGDGACTVVGDDIVCSGIPDNTAGALKITKNSVTCSIWEDCDGDGYTYGYKDCDESCGDCYVDSSIYTTTPDGLDQDCDGIVDNCVCGDTKTCTLTGSYPTQESAIESACVTWCSALGCTDSEISGCDAYGYWAKYTTYTFTTCNSYDMVSPLEKTCCDIGDVITCTCIQKCY